MAYEVKSSHDVGFISAAAIAQYRAVQMQSSGKITQATATGSILGIAQADAEAADRPIPVQAVGISKIELGQNNMTTGTAIKSDAIGRAIPAVAGDPIIGVLLTGGSQGQIASVNLTITLDVAT